MGDGPSTPPRASHPGTLPPNPLTPEQVRRMEEARLRAKARAQQADQAAKAAPPPLTRNASSGSTLAGQKRPYASISSSNVPKTNRDASNSGMTQPASDAFIKPAKNFQRSEYIEYDLSKMTDTKGGFLSTDDDPHNRAMKVSGGPQEQKPAHMTLAEWERLQTIRKLRRDRTGPYEPGISALNSNVGEEDTIDANGKKKEVKGKCRDCGSLEIDWKWEEVFGVSVCNRCKESLPEKYSLLTKTEAREDYLLTDPELKDEELLPHLERPNPHKSNWNNMQLFLRFQVEEYAFSDQRWGSPEALDAEFEKRQVATKARKEKKFKSKLEDLKKRTRVEAYKRAKLMGDAAGEVKFGDKIRGPGDRHEHEWGRSVFDPETGMTRRSCIECGVEIEEIEF